MTPKSLADAIAGLGAVSELRETATTLVFHSSLDTPDQRAYWLLLRQERPAFLSSVHVFHLGTDEELGADQPLNAGERFQISLNKAATPGILRLFYAASLRVETADASLPGAHVIQIADMGADESFASFSARFQMWTTDAVEDFPAAPPLPDPRSCVKDFTGRGKVPSDVRPWLLQTRPIQEGAVFKTWTSLSARRLMACLANQVSISNGTETYHFSGPPSHAITLSEDDLTLIGGDIQHAAKWVFADGKDADARHLLFANEWTRAYRSDQLTGLGQRSLESAKAAYAALIKSNSRETLKALADLRKAIVEEAQKASQRAQDLAGGLWKDLAVASAPFVLKILPDSAKATSELVGGGLACVAAVFLAYSYGMQVFINHRYFKHQEESRVAWRNILITVLAKDEIEEISIRPIEKSIRDYKMVRRFVGAIYGILIAGLIFFGASTLLAVLQPKEGEKDQQPPAAAATQVDTGAGLTSSVPKSAGENASPPLPATMVPPRVPEPDPAAAAPPPQ